MIPGLQNAEFVRSGQMHRNTFINSPMMLDASLKLRFENEEVRERLGESLASDFSILNSQSSIFFAGQLIGVEGYVGNAATGLLAGINAVRTQRGEPLVTLPPTTMLGALCHYITHAEPKHFQPMKANFGILPPLDTLTLRQAQGSGPPRDKRARAAAYAQRAILDMQQVIDRERIVADVTELIGN
jgi:methylenetetrahydrofolate--tRNA-(uracil-5-)-methyltransferase